MTDDNVLTIGEDLHFSLGGKLDFNQIRIKSRYPHADWLEKADTIALIKHLEEVCELKPIT